MLFSSFSFLLWFLPLVVLLHGIAPVRAKNAVLLFASVFFYAWGEIRYLPLIGLSLVLNYGLGIAAASTRPLRRHIAVAASLLLNIGALVFFKYTGFLLGMIGLSACAPMISLPLGISFYTFQTQAYVLDVSQRRFPPERRFIDYATFLLLFPQLIAG
ncbi:MAG: MBOAT family protein, partial [Clostridia bacterium]